MPRGRKRKVPLEEAAESAEESMDEPMDAQPVEKEEEPESNEGEGDSTDAGEGEVSTEQEATEPAAEEDEELEPGEVIPENNECPSVDELKKIKSDGQRDTTRLDVLLCGLCHNAFHLVEELVQHKEGCVGNSTISSAVTIFDNKPQVWAFVLYKAYKMREAGETKDVKEQSWVLYQKWSALDDHLKATWVAAGKALMGIQQYATLATQRHHMHYASQMTATEQHKQTLIQIQKDLEDDDPAPVLTTPRGRPGKKAKKQDDESDRGEVRKRAGENQVLRKTMRKNADETDTELYTVVQIIAKRAASAEYLVRWAGLPLDQPSWEHASNLLTCKRKVEEFERKLARQKARKAAEAARSAEKTAIHNVGSRPLRRSALKALDQVKEWVGGQEADDEEEYQLVTSGGIKKRVVNSANKNPVIVTNARGGLLKIDERQMANMAYLSSGCSDSMLGEDGNETMVDEGDMAVGDADDDGLMRLSMSPGGSVYQIVQLRPKQQAAHQEQQIAQGEDGVIYNLTPEKQQMLLQNGTLTTDTKQEALMEENTEVVIENVQIVRRMIGSEGEGGEGTSMLASDDLQDVMVKQALEEDKDILIEIVQRMIGYEGEGEEGTSMLASDNLQDVNVKQALMKENKEMVIENVQMLRRMIGSEGEGGEGTSMLASDNLQDIMVKQALEEDKDILIEIVQRMIGYEGEGGEGTSMLASDNLQDVIVKPALEENTEVVIGNVQIVRRMIGSEGEGGEGTSMLASDDLQDVMVKQALEEDKDILIEIVQRMIGYEGEGEEGTSMLASDNLQDVIVKPALEEKTEMVIWNGQIVRPMIGSEGEGGEGTFVLADDNLQDVMVEQEEGEDENMLALQSAVQEAVQSPRVTFTTDEGTIDAAIDSADPLAPGATVPNVLLQAADGTLFSTEMDEEQFQPLGFEPV